VVSAAAAALSAAPVLAASELLAAYDAHVDTMPVSASVRFARRRAARQFLNRHPNLGVWMCRSTPARLADLHRSKAWPFASWCFVHRHLVPDVELLLAKPAGVGLPVEWADSKSGQPGRGRRGRSGARVEQELAAAGRAAGRLDGLPAHR
jgi:hypothetical protein